MIAVHPAAKIQLATEKRLANSFLKDIITMITERSKFWITFDWFVCKGRRSRSFVYDWGLVMDVILARDVNIWLRKWQKQDCVILGYSSFSFLPDYDVNRTGQAEDGKRRRQNE